MKNKNTKQNKYPFANEVKEMKDNFKKMIDSMTDEDFLNFINFINSSTETFEEFDDEVYIDDEGWEDEAIKFYGYNTDKIIEDDNLPF